MAELLVNLCGVPKVWGAALYSEEGLCIENRLQPPYEESFVQGVLRDLVAASESYAFLDPSPVAMAIAKAGSGLLAFMCRNRMRVLALADSDVNPVFLHVAFGSLGKKLDALGDDLTSLSANSLGVATSGSHLTIDASQIERLPPTQAVPVEEMKRVLTAYTSFAGPAARMVMKHELKALGFGSSSLPREHFELFIQKLTARLPPAARDTFRKRID